MSLLKEFLKPRSYEAAQKILEGEPGAGYLLTTATLYRAVSTLPGLLLVGIPWKQAVAGSIVGNLFVTATVVGYYLVEQVIECLSGIMKE